MYSISLSVFSFINPSAHYHISGFYEQLIDFLIINKAPLIVIFALLVCETINFFPTHCGSLRKTNSAWRSQLTLRRDYKIAGGKEGVGGSRGVRCVAEGIKCQSLVRTLTSWGGLPTKAAADARAAR